MSQIPPAGQGRPRMGPVFTTTPRDTPVEAYAGDEPPPPRMSRTIWVWLVLALVLAAGLRAGFFMSGPAEDPQRAFGPDSPRYVELAENLREHRSFGRTMESTGVVHVPLERFRSSRDELEPADKVGLRPEILRTPGYPAFISAWLGSEKPLVNVLITQQVLSVVGVLLVFLIGRHLLRSNVAAMIAALIVAVHPADILAANSVLAETLFTTVMLLGFYLVVRNQRFGWILPSTGALAIGLSVLIRPISILLGPAAAIWFLCTQRSRRGVVLAAIMCVLSLTPTAAWMMRNEKAGFGYRISSVPFINAYFYTVAYMDIQKRDLDHEQDWPMTVERLFGQLHTQIEPGEDTFSAMRRLSIDWIKDDPLLYASVLGRSAVKFMTDHSLPSFPSRLDLEYEPKNLRERVFQQGLAALWTAQHPESSTTAPLVWITWNATVVVLTIVGAWFLIIRRQWAALLLLVGTLAYFILATQANGLERFRVPVLGIQALLAGAVLARTRRDVDEHAGSNSDAARAALNLPIPQPAPPQAATAPQSTTNTTHPALVGAPVGKAAESQATGTPDRPPFVRRFV